MKIGSMLSDLLRSLFRRPATERYPYERKAAPERFRGKLVWDPEKCAGCMLCIKDCPANALELAVIDRAKKQMVLHYHPDRCTYCSQCVINCRFKCLDLSSEQWEMASASRQTFEIYYGKEEDIQLFLERAIPKSGEEKPVDGG
jgi:formate hydrogenlyase subunit 6/NADH:ubiquinone oxidoreductase subunit I